MQDNKDADIRHRQMLPYFQHRYLSKMQDIIMDQGIHSIKSKWDSLLEQSTTGKVEVNYSNDITTAAFGVLSRLVFGRAIVDDEGAKGVSTSWIEKSLKFVGIRAMSRLLPLFLAKALLWPWEYRFTRVSDLAHESIAIRKRLMERLEAEGRMDEKPADLLQALIEAEDSETNTKMNYNEIHAESVSIMFAGSDTTALTTLWIVHLLTLYPHHYRRAVEEARSRYSQDHVITYNECRETLPFVEACIYESLRLKPGFGGMLPRVSPKGGIVLQGHFIPENTMVLLNIGPANTHEKHWDRPYEYDPTRFTKDKEAQRNILSFSHGKRACPGRYLALWEIMTIIPNLLKDYDFELPADYTHLGPSVLDERGLPKTMDANLFITYAPSNPKRDCRLRISKAIIKKA
ncbi:hypothetical protein IW140_005300 [Coemansia sp. RSA 1813]|nr:hypothetical protein IW140_005300 [Coemansia sp. RSA 1813]